MLIPTAKMMIARIFEITGWGWCIIAGGVVIFSLGATAYKSGILEVFRLLSPFNVYHYIEVVILLAPGLIFLSVGEKLKQKAQGT